MIALLRGLAFAANVAFVAGAALLLGASPALAAACVAVFFACVAWATARAPYSEPAEREVADQVRAMAERMRVTAPRAVRVFAGDTAAVGRLGLGYQLLIGRGIDASHREAVVAHELAHAATGDVLWEPFTDGPARLLSGPVCAFAPFWLLLFPFFIFGVPLARLTELRADRRAARVVQSYPIALKALASQSSPRPALLYPPVARRLDAAAQDSLSLGSEP